MRALLALLLSLLLAVPAHAQFAMPDQRARSGQIVTATKPQTLTNKTFGSGVVVTLLPLTAGSTIQVPAGVNPPSSNVFSVTLNTNSTFANPTGLVPGQILQFNVAQPASGGPYTLGFGADYQNFSGAAFTVTLNAAASSVTVFQCTTISTSVLQCGQPQGTLTLGSTALALGSTTTTLAGLAGLSYAGTAPAVSACGTSPSIDSHATNNSGTVTVGTVTATSCTITFAGSGFTTWDHCQVTDESAVTSPGYTYTKTAIVVTGTSLVGDLIDYRCDGS